MGRFSSTIDTNKFAIQYVHKPHGTISKSDSLNSSERGVIVWDKKLMISPSWNQRDVRKIWVVSVLRKKKKKRNMLQLCSLL
jgi:hypothetical protein